jgi:hypothetical protein
LVCNSRKAFQHNRLQFVLARYKESILRAIENAFRKPGALYRNVSHFQSAIPRQRSPQGCWKPANLSAQCGDDRSGVFAAHLDQGRKTRMSFHQCRDVTVFCATHEIAFPMAGNGAVLNFCGLSRMEMASAI